MPAILNKMIVKKAALMQGIGFGAPLQEANISVGASLVTLFFQILQEVKGLMKVP